MATRELKNPYIDTKNIIDELCTDIAIYFSSNDMHEATALEQSYMLYKYLKLIGESPTLVKGYIVNIIRSTYFRHFWVECNDVIYDIGTESHLLAYDLEYHEEIVTYRRTLEKEIFPEIQRTFRCTDIADVEKARESRYAACLNDTFMEDVIANEPDYISEPIREYYSGILAKAATDAATASFAATTLLDKE